jgi:putative protein-disulfide isomerase
MTEHGTLDTRDRQILYFADPMCSWCWGFSPVIKTLFDIYGDRIRITMNMGGLRAGNTAPTSAAMREEILNHWQHVTQMTGQAFSFKGALPDGFVYDTEPACRAVVTVRELNEPDAFSYFSALQEAFYVRQLDVTRPDILADLAIDYGVARERFQGTFESDSLKVKTAAEFQFARHLGIGGFPSVVLKDAHGFQMLTSGYQPFERLQAHLERWLMTDKNDQREDSD